MSSRFPCGHDDQQGTAIVVCAGLINALEIVGKKMGEASMCLLGAGAANITVARIIIEAGVDPGNIIMVDSKGLLSRARKDLRNYPAKWNVCLTTNKENRVGGLKEAMKGADALIAISTPGPGVVPEDFISLMSDDPIVFACANPVPEIWPWETPKRLGQRSLLLAVLIFQTRSTTPSAFPLYFGGP